MKKVLFTLLLAVLLFGATPVYAGPDINSLTNKVANESGFDVAGTSDTTISQTIGGIVRVLLGLTGTIFLVLTIYGGFLWMTAGGNEDQVEKALNIFKRSVVGLIIVLASYSITYFVMSYAFKVSEPTNQVGSTKSKSSGSWFSDFGKGFAGGMNKQAKKVEASK